MGFTKPQQASQDDRHGAGIGGILTSFPHGQSSFSSGQQKDAQETNKDPAPYASTFVVGWLALYSPAGSQLVPALGPSGGRSQRWWTAMSKGRLASVKPKSKPSLPEPNWEQTAFECHLKPRVSSVIVLAGCPECTLQTDSWPPALFSFCLVPGFSRRPWVWREAARFSSPIW